eukprot:547889-Pleurochrysis_carterae.AAC.1
MSFEQFQQTPSAAPVLGLTSACGDACAVPMLRARVRSREIAFDSDCTMARSSDCPRPFHAPRQKRRRRSS